MINNIASSPNLFVQLALPQVQLLNAAAQLPQFALPSLLSAYSQAMGPASLLQSAPLPPFLAMPSPASILGVSGSIAGSGYAGQQQVDLAPFSPNNFLARAFNPERREAARMETVLRNDPFARAAFEHAVGGRIVDFGDKNDGRFTVERFPQSPYLQALGAANPITASIGAIQGQMLQGLGAAVSGLAGSINPFLGLALGGATQIASQLIGGGGFASFNGGVQGMAPLSGMGAASWNPLAQPGLIQGTNAGYEKAHSAQVNSVLSDPSLTMEDKVMLAMMLICQKFDQDIKSQTKYIEDLQNQQGNRAGKAGKAGGGKTGKAGGGGGGEKSIDLETKKLERLITKRSQLFDTLGKIMERYDQSAKNVIQSMRG